VGTYGKDNNYFSCISNNDSEVESYFKTFEGFMDDDVLDLRRRYEGRGRSGKEIW
jgi:hypothetical protein